MSQLSKVFSKTYGKFVNSRKLVKPFNNSFWSVVLSQLRTNAFIFGAIETNAQKESLLSQLDDALEFARINHSSYIDNRSVDLTQIASDFAEGYSRRFGPVISSQVSLFVDHLLPMVNANPDKLIRLLDSLVRSAHQSATKNIVEITMRESKSTLASKFDCQLVISCRGIHFSTSFEQIKELLELSKNNISPKCVRDFGLELCAALYIIYDLEGSVEIVRNASQEIVLEIRLPFEKVLGKNTSLEVPQKLYVYTKSTVIKKHLEKVALFHQMNFCSVVSTAEIPLSELFVFDATDYTPYVASELDQLPKPSQAILLLANTEISKLRKLAALGFCHFATCPLVSTKILRSLSGLDVYQLPKATQQISDFRKFRILIVDDVPTARIVLRDYFECNGHGVIEASDGSEFIARIQQGEVFDIIFCDLTMNHMDGATAVELLRSHEEKSKHHTPVVLMTAYSEIGESNISGFDRIIAKPIDTNVVAEIVKELVPSIVPKSPVNPPTQVIDLEDLRHRCAGKTRTMINVLESFIETSQSNLLKLRLPEVQADPSLLGKALHTLKGLLRDAGAKESAQLIEGIEDKVKCNNYQTEGDLVEVEHIVNGACSSAMKVKDVLVT